MARAIDGDRIEKIFEEWLNSIPDGEETPAIESCLNVVKNAPTITLPNETLTCEGCVYLEQDTAPCAYCVRMKQEKDYYRRVKDETD